MLQSAFVLSNKVSLGSFSIVSEFLRSFLVVGALASFYGVMAQDANPTPTPSPTPAPVTARPQTAKEMLANPTAEAVVETALFVYGPSGGRAALNQIRKTAIERGKTTVLNGQGKMETANYQKWMIRGDTISKEKLRFDQEFPTVRFSLILNEDKTFGIYNDSMFAPTEEASKSFHNQIYRGLDALLRYKENESTIALSGKDKVLGVEYHLVDLTDKAGRKTRFFVSTKTYRVMMLEYEEDGKKYRRKFYDYNYAQGTLVPYRTVLYENDKIVEETNIGTVTYGQRVDEAMFPTGS